SFVCSPVCSPVRHEYGGLTRTPADTEASGTVCGEPAWLSRKTSSGAAQESNPPRRGLHDLAGFAHRWELDEDYDAPDDRTRRRPIKIFRGSDSHRLHSPPESGPPSPARRRMGQDKIRSPFGRRVGPVGLLPPSP